MATNKKQTTGESGGGTALLALPEGYTTGKNKFYAEGVARRFDMLPPEVNEKGGGGVRVLLVANKDATDEQVTALLGQNPRHQLRMKAPGIWEANLKPRDMEQIVAPNVGADKTFRWVDLGNRFFGLPVRNASDMAEVAIAYDGSMGDAKKKLKSLGVTITEPTAPPEANQEEGEWVNPDEGLILGTIQGGKLYDLALLTKATSIEVRGVTGCEAKG